MPEALPPSRQTSSLGVFLPVSGAACTRAGLRHAAETAERLGFTTVWAADRIVIPWEIEAGLR